MIKDCNQLDILWNTTNKDMTLRISETLHLQLLQAVMMRAQVSVESHLSLAQMIIKSKSGPSFKKLMITEIQVLGRTEDSL